MVEEDNEEIRIYIYIYIERERERQKERERKRAKKRENNKQKHKLIHRQIRLILRCIAQSRSHGCCDNRANNKSKQHRANRTM